MSGSHLVCFKVFPVIVNVQQWLKKTDTRVLKNPNGINYIDEERSLLHPKVSRMARPMSEAEICKAQRPPWSCSHPHRVWACRDTMPQQVATKGSGVSKDILRAIWGPNLGSELRGGTVQPLQCFPWWALEPMVISSTVLRCSPSSSWWMHSPWMSSQDRTAGSTHVYIINPLLDKLLSHTVNHFIFPTVQWGSQRRHDYPQVTDKETKVRG